MPNAYDTQQVSTRHMYIWDVASLARSVADSKLANVIADGYEPEGTRKRSIAELERIVQSSPSLTVTPKKKAAK